MGLVTTISDEQDLTLHLMARTGRFEVVQAYISEWLRKKGVQVGKDEETDYTLAAQTYDLIEKIDPDSEAKFLSVDERKDISQFQGLSHFLENTRNHLVLIDLVNIFKKKINVDSTPHHIINGAYLFLTPGISRSLEKRKSEVGIEQDLSDIVQVAMGCMYDHETVTEKYFPIMSQEFRGFHHYLDVEQFCRDALTPIIHHQRTLGNNSGYPTTPNKLFELSILADKIGKDGKCFISKLLRDGCEGLGIHAIPTYLKFMHYVTQSLISNFDLPEHAFESNNVDKIREMVENYDPNLAKPIPYGLHTASSGSSSPSELAMIVYGNNSTVSKEDVTELLKSNGSPNFAERLTKKMVDWYFDGRMPQLKGILDRSDNYNNSNYDRGLFENEVAQLVALDVKTLMGNPSMDDKRKAYERLDNIFMLTGPEGDVLKMNKKDVLIGDVNQQETVDIIPVITAQKVYTGVMNKITKKKP
tara:strand:- start:2870 stop:4285 length:1416 start_codon:yes stop_codon:yes gene_type:complete